MKRSLALQRSILYEGGNKCGRALKQCTMAQAMHMIRDQKGKERRAPEEVAEQFRLYYNNLYNLPQTNHTLADTTKIWKTWALLNLISSEHTHHC